MKTKSYPPKNSFNPPKP